MKLLRILWDDEDESEGNVAHIAEHGLTIEDVEHVLENPIREETSRSTGRPCCFGYTQGGDFIVVVYEPVDGETIYPITAYEVSEP
jgi:uncharacterized DUF497 family protein